MGGIQSIVRAVLQKKEHSRQIDNNDCIIDVHNATLYRLSAVHFLETSEHHANMVGCHGNVMHHKC